MNCLQKTRSYFLQKINKNNITNYYLNCFMHILLILEDIKRAIMQISWTKK